jgi:hypothetical protein
MERKDASLMEQVKELEEFMRDADDWTKLNSCLIPYVEFPEEGNWCAVRLRHPWVYSVIGPLLPHQCNKLFEQKSAMIRKAWREGNWWKVLMCHERPYRMSLLEKLYFTGRMDIVEMRSLLLDFWTDTEIPQSNQTEPLALFKEAVWLTDDQDGYDSLPDVLTLYRGVDGVCELSPDGPSWTLDRKVADFFAKRYAQGKTYTIRVKKNDSAVLAYITDRSEAEVILDFGKLNKGHISLVEDFSG